MYKHMGIRIESIPKHTLYSSTSAGNTHPLRWRIPLNLPNILN